MTLESATPEPIWFEDDDTRAILVDTAALPDGGQLRLMRRDGEFAIMYGREQLMGSWDSASEQGLARMVCDRLALPDVRLLIGGLGMGFHPRCRARRDDARRLDPRRRARARGRGVGGGGRSRICSRAGSTIRACRSKSPTCTM